MQFDFRDKRVLITGGSRGIGRAAALAFAQAGAQVAITYHEKAEAAEQVIAQLAGTGHRAEQLDLADAQAVKAVVDQVADAFGGLDILVNNAGVFLPHPVDGLPFDEWLTIWRRTIDTNLTGAAAAAYAAAQHMISAGGGKLIQVGSRGAYRGEPGQPAYGASKAGLHAFSQSLAQALGGHGITVHAVAPGFVETAMVRPWLQGEAGEAVKRQSPLNRVATVEDVARAILFLASPEAEFTTGCVLDLNGASYLH